jgi:hypothetical protein
MFDEVPPRQSFGEQVRRWTEIGWYMLTGFLASAWGELLLKRRLLALVFGAAWILVWIAALWGMSGVKRLAYRPTRTRHYHFLWAGASALILAAATLALSRNVAPFEAALVLYIAFSVFISHVFAYSRILKSEKIEVDNSRAPLTHGQ